MRVYLIILALAACGCGSSNEPATTPSTFLLTSPELQDGATLPIQQVYNEYGCTGQNRAPALRWRNPPHTTKSFAVTLIDPDAQNGSGLLHWMVYDIPPSVTNLPADAGGTAPLPTGATVGPNSFGMNGYAGACPPEGDVGHHYVFTVHALDVDHLEIPEGGAPARADGAIGTHELARATLTATYAR